jgi:hypothetical protein
MDKQSAVEYWEKFAAHAFDNSRQSVMTTCILKSATDMPVPCTFCFTIKRDIFDIPLAIVGNVSKRSLLKLIENIVINCPL